MTKRGFQSLKTKALKELYRIGCCYEHGDGVEKDAVEAVKWYRASAARGFAPAMDNLSSCYNLGVGVRKDEKEGLAWKVRSMAARGDRNAAAWLQQNGY